MSNLNGLKIYLSIRIMFNSAFHVLNSIILLSDTYGNRTALFETFIAKVSFEFTKNVSPISMNFLSINLKLLCDQQTSSKDTLYINLLMYTNHSHSITRIN